MRRFTWVTFRVTGNEKKQIQKSARKLNKPVGEFLRDLCKCWVVQKFKITSVK